MKKQVFICHSSSDTALVKKLVKQLEDKGCRCWISYRDIQPGSDWAECIYTALAESAALVLVHTANTNSSWQIRNELDIATNLKIPIIPILFESTELSKSIKYFTNSHQWLDASGSRKNYSSVVDAIVRLSSQAPPSAQKPVNKKSGKPALIVLSILIIAVTIALLVRPHLQEESDYSEMLNLVAGGTDTWDYATDAVNTSSGGMIVTGTWDWGFWSELWITSFDSAWNITDHWSDSLSGECKPLLLPTADRGCIAAFGEYADFDHTGFMFRAIRFDSTLSTVWESETWIDYTGAVQPDITSLCYLPDSSVAVSITLRVLNSIEQSANFIVFDSDNGKAEHFTIPNTRESRCMDTSASGRILTFVREPETLANAFYIIDSAGNILDFHIFGDRNITASCMKILPDSTIVAAFTEDRFGGGNGDVAVVRFSQDFEVLWQKSFGGDMQDNGNDIELMENGDIIIAGATTSVSSGSRDGWVLCLGPEGNLLWESTIDTGSSDYIASVTLMENGNLLLTGATSCFGDNDAWMIEMTPDGHTNNTPALGIELFSEDWEKGFIDQSTWEIAYNRNYSPEVMQNNDGESRSLNTNNVPLLLREQFPPTPGLTFQAEVTVPSVSSSGSTNWLVTGTTVREVSDLLSAPSREIDCGLKWHYSGNSNGQTRALEAICSRVSPCSIYAVPDSLLLTEGVPQLLTIENCADSVKFFVNDTMFTAFETETRPDSIHFFLAGSSMSVPHRIDNIRVFLRRW